MPQAPRIPTAEWEAHKALIKDLWINQNKTLDEVMQYMAELGFCPSYDQTTHAVSRPNWQLYKETSVDTQDKCQLEIAEELYQRGMAARELPFI